MHDEAIELARTLPKAELHVHLEGTLQPELIMRFSERNNRPVPYASVEDIRAAYQFEDLAEFIQIYLNGFKSIATAQDYIELTEDFCNHAIEDNIIHIEVFTEAQGGKSVGTPLSEIMGGVIAAAAKCRKRGVELLLIPTFLRHESEDRALEALDELGPYYDNMVAIGLASTEVGFPPENFRRLFDRARALGFKLVAHAGEEGPPEYVWGALDELGVDRIDHGIRSIEDPVLMSRLERDGIPLTMCPISNLKLNVVKNLEDYPLKQFLNAGIKATVNSDDPGYFGAYLNENFEAVIRALNLSTADVRTLVQNSLDARFDPPKVN